jgi:flavin-dependent dehydrogenase
MIQQGGTSVRESTEPICDNSNWDVVIIGAGVAGSTAALSLIRLHPTARVLLLERSIWPRQKVCGCCLSRRAVSLLGELGVSFDASAIRATDEPTRIHAAKLSGYRLSCGRMTAQIAVAGGVAVSRASLDSAIVNMAVEHGVVFYHGVSVCVDPEMPTNEKPLWRVRLSSSSLTASVHARRVIVADGLAGASLREVTSAGLIPPPSIKPRSRVGVSCMIESGSELSQPGIISMYVAADGYVGAVTMLDGSVNLAAAVSPNAVKSPGGPKAAVSRVLHSCGATPPSLANVRLLGAGQLTRRRPIRELPGLIAIGDASSYVEPFTGEGMSWAAAEGIAAGRAVGASLSREASVLSGESLVGTAHEPRRTFISMIRPLLRSPVVCTAAIQGLRLPGISGLAVRACGWGEETGEDFAARDHSLSTRTGATV